MCLYPLGALTAPDPPHRCADHLAVLALGAATGLPSLAPERGRELARLRRIRDRIGREHAQALNLEALARAERMPAGRLSREFRLAYGESVEECLLAVRSQRQGRVVNRRAAGVV